MSSHSSTALTFDPDSGTLPDDLPLPPEDGGEVILLMADPAARESGWGPQAAVALARGWAARERRIFLMDGDPIEPALHTVLGEDNREGVTDAVRYGVSPSRMAMPEGDNLLFAPAGTVVADPASVLRHPRWSSVLAACREAGSVVLLYLPEGRPGVEHLAGEGDRVVRLRGSADDAAVEPGVVTLHPPSPDTEGAAAAAGAAPGEASIPSAVGSPEGASTGSWAAGRAPSEGRGRAPKGRGASSWRGAAGPKGSTGKEADFGPRVIGRRATAWIILIVLLLVGGVVAAAWLGYLEIPGITRPPGAAMWVGGHSLGSAVGLVADLPRPAP